MPLRPAPSLRALLAFSLLAVTVSACQAEQRPVPGSVRTIGSPSASSSVSQSVSAPAPAGSPAVAASAVAANPSAAASPAASPAAAPSKPDGIYTPMSNRDPYQAIALDYQAIAALSSRVEQGKPLPSAEILDIYENARNTTASRALRRFARDEARGQEFPEAAQFYGTATFLDTPVIDAINGTGSAASYTPPQRAEAIQKGLERIMAYWTLRYVNQGRTALNPGLVDEAWAIYMGPPGDGTYPDSLSALARSREGNFNRAGSIDTPLRQALSRAQQAAVGKDQAAYGSAATEATSRLYAIFYLGTARYLNESLKSAQGGNAADAGAQQVEGLSFYQVLQPLVAKADAAADKALVAYFTATPATLTSSLRDDVLTALNRTASALLLTPGDLVTPGTFGS